MNRSKLKWIYLLFSILGLVVPWYYNLHYIYLNGLAAFTLKNYFEAGLGSDLAASITTDFFIGTTPVLIWMMVEAFRLKMKNKWWYFIGTFCIAFSFTCPLFLYFRECYLEKRNTGERIVSTEPISH
jgi:Terpene cyclase DEP1